ncbi:MAG: DUF1501 domain-containing protein [Gemmataceae bacterium]|nr:DUF1501 domain-containing protein [Gemmataceae bacterium]
MIHRRHLLRIGGLAALGLPDLLRARDSGIHRGTFGRARSVILLYLHGGHAQQETFDPKPDGPSPERGEFGAIATSVPGVRFGELLPRSAALMHKLAVIRSMSHPNANHVQASLAAMTGHSHPPAAESRGDFPPSQDDFPPFGAVLDSLRKPGPLPAWVQVGPLMRRFNGTILHGQSPGFLGARHAPLSLDRDRRAVRPEVSVSRLEGRRRLLERIDAQRRLLDQAEAQSLDGYQKRAMRLLASSETGKAFDLESEPARVRERYGPTAFGQSCLLARRLAEAGVPVINVHYCHTPAGSWDTHGQHFKLMKESLCPTFDRAFAALVGDLDDRGLLDRTLVLANAEFGRTPKINKAAGRDHWPWAYSLAMAGGGGGRGVVVGATDKVAAHPVSHPHDPKDMAATVYHLLGVPPTTEVRDRADRPHAVVIGKRIDALLA